MGITRSDLRRGEEYRLEGGMIRPSGHVVNGSGVGRSAFRHVDLPLCGLSYEAHAHGLIADAWTALDLRRLGGGKRYVRQLQFLTGHRVDGQTLAVPGPHTFPHTRWQHSLGVAGIMDVMSHNQDLDDVWRKLGILLGSSHDGATTAAGDAMKIFYLDDPQQKLFVDEDAQFLTIFNRRRKAWMELAERHHLPRESIGLMAAGIKGKGVLGHLLNIADTSSYVALDVAELKMSQQRILGARFFERCPACFREIFDLARREPCAIWESIAIHDGKVVVQDVDRLTDFLKLRVLLWIMLYEHVESKFLEQLFVGVIAPYIYHKGLVDVDRLRRWDDARLIHLLDGLFEASIATDLNCLGQPPICETFTEVKEAQRRERELFDQGAFTLLFHADRLPKVSTKTNKYFVLGSGGRVLTYGQAFPKESEVLRQRASQLEQRSVWVLYHVPKTLFSPQMSPHFRAAWEMARQKWVESLK